MVHVKVVVSRIVGVQDHLLAALRSGIEQHVDAERVIIKKEVTSLGLHATMGARRVDLHFIFALEEHPIRGAQVADHILH